MLFESLILNTSDILKIAFKSSQPTDFVVSQLLREKKYIGSKERQFVSESIYAVLRNYTFVSNVSNLLFNDITDTQPDFRKYIISIILLCESNIININFSSVNLLSRIYPNKEIHIGEWIKDFALNNNLINSEQSINWNISSKNVIEQNINNYISNINTNNLDTISNIYSMPEWIGQNLLNNSAEPAQLACSLNFSAPVCIRISNNTSISVVENLLINMSIPFHKSKLVPNCLILEKRAKIDDSEEYKTGLFEIQDEGSQFISYALSPAGNCTILDACAGAGGKTLHLSDICPEAKEIIAADNNFVRLKEFTKRLTRYNKKNISTKFVKSMYYNDIKQLFGNKLFDYVLVDAPCTGIGTARRDPLKKFRTTSKIAEKMQQKQLDILKTYSKFVKPGGILVYATCSFLTTENNDVVNTFIETEPEFEPDNLYNVFTNHGINPFGIAPESYYFGLYPHIHGTDGFFMARMKRVN